MSTAWAADNIDYYAQEMCNPEILRAAKIANPQTNPVELKEYKEYIKCFNEKNEFLREEFKVCDEELYQYNANLYSSQLVNELEKRTTWNFIVEEKKNALNDCNQLVLEKNPLPIKSKLYDSSGQLYSCDIWSEKITQQERTKYSVFPIGQTITTLTEEQKEYKEKEAHYLSLYQECRNIEKNKESTGAKDLSQNEIKSEITKPEINCGKGTIEIDGICQLDKSKIDPAKKSKSWFSWIFNLFG